MDREPRPADPEPPTWGLVIGMILIGVPVGGAINMWLWNWTVALLGGPELGYRGGVAIASVWIGLKISAQTLAARRG